MRWLVLLFACTLATAQNFPYKVVKDSDNLSTTGIIVWHIEDSTGSNITSPSTSKFPVGAVGLWVAYSQEALAGAVNAATQPSTGTQPGTGGTVMWSYIVGKPLTFAPPLPTASVLGGAKSLTCTGTDKFSALGTDGAFVCSADAGGGAVSSVFGRTGAVTAASNDYSFAQLSSIPTTVSGYGITDAVTTARTVSTTSPLGGGGALSGNLTLTCTTCLTALPNPSSSTLGGVKSLTCGAGTHIQTIGTDGLPVCSSDSGGGAGSKLFVTSAYTNATTNFTNVSGLSFAVSASTNYYVECHITWQGSATTTGPKFQWTGPASPTAVAANATIATTVTTLRLVSAVAFSSSMAQSGTITATTNFPAIVTVGVANGANAGTVQLQAAANGSGTLTIQPGSFCAAQ